MPISPAAQQVLCGCITADMRSPNTCCASVSLLMGDIFFDNLPILRRDAWRRVWDGWRGWDFQGTKKVVES